MYNRADKVWNIFKDCLFTDEELELAKGKTPEGAVMVEGIMHTFGLNPERLKKHDTEIVEILTGLPKEFYADSGGGWSFLNLCMDAENNQWGEQINAEQLCVLAIATGRGQFMPTREMWSILPGSMPYVQFDLKK